MSIQRMTVGLISDGEGGKGQHFDCNLNLRSPDVHHACRGFSLSTISGPSRSNHLQAQLKSLQAIRGKVRTLS